MFATPSISYNDNPAKNLEFLEALDDNEARLYTLGYIQACHHVMESLSDTRRHFLYGVLNSEHESVKSRLIAHVKLLDLLDSSIKERVELLNSLENMD